MQHRRFDTQLPEGVTQCLLGNRELLQLTGQRLSELSDALVALPIVFEELQSRLQVQVNGTGPSAKLLRQRLPSALRGRQCCC